MSTICVNGIVVGYTDYRENSRMLTLFTAEQGRIDAMARDCRRPTAPLLVCAQMFAYGEYELYVKNDRHTLRQCELRESFFSLREDFDAFTIAGALAQLCRDVVQENQPSPELFSLFYVSLSHLAYGQGNPGDLLVYFLLHFFRHLGQCPTITHCASCGEDLRQSKKLFFSARSGGAVCTACASGSTTVSATVLEVMRRILLLPETEIARVTLKPLLRAELLHLLIHYGGEHNCGGHKAYGVLENLIVV